MKERIGAEASFQINYCVDDQKAARQGYIKRSEPGHMSAMCGQNKFSIRMGAKFPNRSFLRPLPFLGFRIRQKIDTSICRQTSRSGNTSEGHSMMQ